MRVEEFLRSVTKGEDSFAADPPNAVVSATSGGEVGVPIVARFGRQLGSAYTVDIDQRRVPAAVLSDCMHRGDVPSAVNFVK